ncbi:MAG: hypothetical protein KBG28_21320 [Kofleriaceae bacterium]|nr:hypothetical protein [Kofleriaceae bacterium]
MEARRAPVARLGIAAALLAAACYEPPVAPCTIRCTTTCPGDLTCEVGWCTTADQICPDGGGPLPSMSQVATAGGAACAIDVDGGLWCWGDNRSGQLGLGDLEPRHRPVEVDAGPGWTAVDLGNTHGCGVRAGQLLCWGSNRDGQVGVPGQASYATPTPVAPVGADWTAVALGDDHTCGLAGGALYCWGGNQAGELGTGELDQDELVPRRVGTASDWTAIATWRHSCGLRGQGDAAALYCWGPNQNRQLGIDGAGAEIPAPTDPVDLSAVATAAPASVSVGGRHTCAVLQDTSAFCWGDGNQGALGQEDSASPNQGPPQRVSVDNTGWQQIAVGDAMACGLRSGALACWGSSDSGGLAQGFMYSFSAFFQHAERLDTLDVASTPQRYDSFVADERSAGCGIQAGVLACWGDNHYGLAGQGAATRRDTPGEVERLGGQPWTELSLGDAHACARAGAEFRCWGSDEFGQTSNDRRGGESWDCTGPLCDVPAPAPLTTLPLGAAPTAVVAGAHHSCALHGGQISCWGRALEGQLGTVDVGDDVFQLARPQGAPWTAVRAAGAATCGQAGTVGWSCVGLADYSSGGADIDLAGVVFPADLRALTSAWTTVCTLVESDAFLRCLGDNRLGQYGALIPDAQALVSTGNEFTAAALGLDHGCGVDVAGGVRCWGRGEYRETGELDPPPNDDVAEVPVVVTGAGAPLAGCSRVTAGYYHSCALCAGEVSCWGDNRFGQRGQGLTATDDPTPFAEVVARPAGVEWVDLRAGGTVTCGLSSDGRVFCWGLGVRGELGHGAFTAVRPLPITEAGL